MDLAAVDADLAAVRPRAGYNPLAAMALRAAELLRAEVDRVEALRKELAGELEDLQAEHAKTCSNFEEFAESVAETEPKLRARAGWSGVLAAHLRFLAQAVEQVPQITGPGPRAPGWVALLRAVQQARAALAALDQQTPPPATPATGTTLTVPDSPKMLRETLCVAQVALGYYAAGDRYRQHVDRLGRLTDACDRHRPLGPDGRHGHRHTATCGCQQHDEPDQPAADVLAEVAAERRRQDQRWGEQNHPDGTGPRVAHGFPGRLEEHAKHARWACQQAATDGLLTWRHIFLEEVYEALAEANPAKLRTELIQAAAVAAAWVEAIDRRLSADLRTLAEVRGEHGPELGDLVQAQTLYAGLPNLPAEPAVADDLEPAEPTEDQLAHWTEHNHHTDQEVNQAMMREGTTYLQVRMHRGWELRVVKTTQRKPDVIEPGCVVVKIQLRGRPWLKSPTW